MGVTQVPGETRRLRSMIEPCPWSLLSSRRCRAARERLGATQILCRMSRPRKASVRCPWVSARQREHPATRAEFVLERSESGQPARATRSLDPIAGDPRRALGRGPLGVHRPVGGIALDDEILAGGNLVLGHAVQGLSGTPSRAVQINQSSGRHRRHVQGRQVVHHARSSRRTTRRRCRALGSAPRRSELRLDRIEHLAHDHHLGDPHRAHRRVLGLDREAKPSADGGSHRAGARAGPRCTSRNGPRRPLRTSQATRA